MGVLGMIRVIGVKLRSWVSPYRLMLMQMLMLKA